jgi:RNA polymerase sigma-70 factor (ECF subfamily)
MDPNSPSSAWHNRLRCGGRVAADQVFARYAKRLVRVAELHLARRLASRIDGEDVVQSVFRTFFRRAEAGEFHIDSSAKLWQLLVRITVLKARAKGRYHTAGKRDASAEVGGDPGEILAGAVGGEPGPAEAAELLDQIDALLHGLPDLYARVLELRLSGDSVAEVADRLGLSRQGVYRMLKLLQDRLRAADPGAHSADAAGADPQPPG